VNDFVAELLQVVAIAEGLAVATCNNLAFRRSFTYESPCNKRCNKRPFFEGGCCSFFKSCCSFCTSCCSLFFSLFLPEKQWHPMKTKRVL